MCPMVLLWHKYMYTHTYAHTHTHTHIYTHILHTCECEHREGGKQQECDRKKMKGREAKINDREALTG